MSTVDFIRGSLEQLHRSYDAAIADLSPEHLHWRATDTGLPISFILWHYVRTEDNIIQFVLQRKPTVWIEGGWYEKLSLHRTAQGTGMSLEDAPEPADRLAGRLAGLSDGRLADDGRLPGLGG